MAANFEDLRGSRAYSVAKRGFRCRIGRFHTNALVPPRADFTADELRDYYRSAPPSPAAMSHLADDYLPGMLGDGGGSAYDEALAARRDAVVAEINKRGGDR